MGFRKHRRHRGGGGGGGQHAHDGRAWTGEANGLQPVDDVGNRVDASPTHEISGILLDLDPKKRRRGRPKGSAPLERVGRYLVGGVNPVVAGGNRPAPPPPESTEHTAEFDADETTSSFRPHDQGQQGQQGQHGQQQGRRERQQQQPQRKKFEQVDGVAAQEVNERRAQRFFDFDEDDRFEYTLKTPAETKRKEAEAFVASIVKEAGRDAVVAARVIEDGDKPKLLVTIDDKGAAADLPAERRADNAGEPLFVMGNAALMSLNYIVNKVVNRYPDDRIRLAVLPLADERLYLDSLDEHRRRAPAAAAPAPRPAPPPAERRPPPPLEPPAMSEADREAAILDAVDVEPPTSLLNTQIAPVPAPPAPPAAAVPLEDEPDEAPRSSKKKVSSRAKKPKRGEEIIPPPSALPPEPPPEAKAEAQTEDPTPAQKAADAADDVPATPRGRGRRAPPEEAPAAPARASVPLDDGKKPLRPRPRRTSTALVEVVRVPKKP